MMCFIFLRSVLLNLYLQMSHLVVSLCLFLSSSEKLMGYFKADDISFQSFVRFVSISLTQSLP